MVWVEMDEMVLWGLQHILVQWALWGEQQVPEVLLMLEDLWVRIISPQVQVILLTLMLQEIYLQQVVTLELLEHQVMEVHRELLLLVVLVGVP